MLLPTFLMMAVCWGVQQPAPTWTVTAGGGTVARETVQRVATVTEAALRELVPQFGGLEPAPFRVVVHESQAFLPGDLRGGHHAGSPGLAVLDRSEIHLLWREMREQPGNGVRSVVAHEVVHILLHQLAGQWGHQVPRWFHEGLAQTLAGDTYLGGREADIIWRATTRRLLYFSDLVEGFPERSSELQLAYGQSYSYVSYLVRRFGLEAMLGVIRSLDAETTFARGLVRATGLPTAALEDAWTEYLLHGSGAGPRAMLDMCFPLSMVLALPLLALALMRRLGVDSRVRGRMAQQEASAEVQGPPLPPEGLP